MPDSSAELPGEDLDAESELPPSEASSLASIFESTSASGGLSEGGEGEAASGGHNLDDGPLKDHHTI